MVLFVGVVCIRETTVPTEYGNHSLFLVVVCIRDDHTKLFASVGLAQARPNNRHGSLCL